VSLKELIRKVNKHIQGGVITLGGEGRVSNQQFFPTGFSSLDAILGGGLAIGKVIELFGWEGVGKSTFALQMSKRMNDRGRAVLWVDFEHAFNMSYALALGVDMNKFLISQPSYGEEGLEVMRICVNDKSGEVGLIVVDSVAALGSQDELEGSLEDHYIGKSAALLARGLKGVIHNAEVNQITLLFINQLRETVGRGVVMKRTPGGYLLKFLASQRIEIAMGKKSDDGFEAKFKVIKNKFSIPYQETQLFFRWGSGFVELLDKVADGRKGKEGQASEKSESEEQKKDAKRTGLK
jgi:recombination protein RecA